MSERRKGLVAELEEFERHWCPVAMGGGVQQRHLHMRRIIDQTRRDMDAVEMVVQYVSKPHYDQHSFDDLGKAMCQVRAMLGEEPGP